ncbi:MAG: ABC transporter permease [Planctomycetota bacterium]|jgi:peptide/nickel transport system permease protein
MTEPQRAGQTGYSKDYWDIVMSHLRRRPSVRISLVVLALFYASAIYAPFLAGDRPFVIEAVDEAGYKRALSMLTPIGMGLRGLVRDGQEAQPEGGGQSFEQALAAERDALVQRVETMRRQLAPEDAALLEGISTAAGDAVARAADGDTEAALAHAEQVVALAKQARVDLAPGEGVSLESDVRYPALDAISRAELYAMLLWALVLLWPVWNTLVNRVVLSGDRERIRRARRVTAAAMVLLPLLPLPFWSATEKPYTTSAYKEGLTKGEITAQRVIMPPVSFGLAEINDSEYLRAPTWSKGALMDDEGRYLNSAGRMVDESTGFEVEPVPVEIRHGEPALNAAARHPLGTDSLGRDMLARMVWGGRVSLSVGLVSTVFLVLIGTILGALAGYFGGRVDMLISRVIEIFQCFPAFFLILIVVAFIGPSILNIMLVIGITRWPGVARLVRGEFLRLRGQDFVVASEALGVPQRRTIFRHILPNALGPVLVAATFSVASGIITESALSFLGLGIQAPVPSWGSLLIESRSPEHWWIQVFPGVLIFITVILYNLLGEGVRDALDPRQVN